MTRSRSFKIRSQDHDTLFILAEVAHFLGIGILVFKLQRKKSVAGDSGEDGHGQLSNGQLQEFYFLHVSYVQESHWSARSIQPSSFPSG